MKKFLLSLLILFISFGGHFNLAFAEEPIGLGFNHLLTHNTSPELRGSISSTTNLMVVVKVEGRGEVGTDIFENNEWVLPADCIQPPLENGSYDISLEAQDSDGNVLGQFFLKDGIEINDQYVAAPTIDLMSPADVGNEKNFNVLVRAEPEQAIEVKIDDGLNTPISHTELTDPNGTMRHTFDISSLWDGEIKISTIATNIYNNSQSSEVVRTIEKNSATLSLPTVLSGDVITSQNTDNFSITGRGVSNSTLYYYFINPNGNVLDGTGNIGSLPFYKLYSNLSTFSDGDVRILVGLKNSNGATSKLVERTVLKDTIGPEIYSFEADPYINKNNASSFHVKVVTEPNSEMMIVGTEGLAPVYTRIQADDNGISDFNMDFSELLDGDISIYLSTYDQYENSDDRNIKILKDTLSPEPPQISNTLANISSSSDCIRSMTGTAEPDSDIRYAILNNGIETASDEVKTDNTGSFNAGEIDFSGYADGEIEVLLTSVDSFGNESDVASVSFNKNIVVATENIDTSEVDEASSDIKSSGNSDTAQLISTNTNTVASTSETLPLAGSDWFKIELLVLLTSYSFWRMFLLFSAKRA